MALSLSQTAALQSMLDAGMRVAAMGYPDVIAPLTMLDEWLGDKVSELQYRQDSETICNRHGLRQRQIPDAHSLFSLLGCKLDVYDIVRERGCEIILDLNEPMDGQQQYDIVLDVGTVEHCFNIAQAVMNMAQMVKEGGYIIHENPFNCGNHGFYNLSPTLFHDFYTQNGFEVLECMLASRDGRQAVVPRTGRFKFVAEELNVFCVARRTTIKPFVYPVQSKYAHSIPDAGGRAKRDADASGDRRNEHG